MSIAIISSYLPDIDHRKSFIGRRLQPISTLANFIFGHRGLLHSLLPPIIVFVILLPISPLVASAFFVGYLSHLMLDALTPKGIMPLYPLRIKVKGIIRTNSLFENFLGVSASLLILSYGLVYLLQ